MSWSLKIQNGDLVVGNAKLAKVTGTAKLVQDLSHWIMTRLGTDEMHRNYGATIDGGTNLDGSFTPSLIGGLFQTFGVESELRRIVNEYQVQQLNRAKEDSLFYSKTTLTADEILLALDNIEFVQNQDKLIATLSITTAAGSQLSVNLAIPTA